MLPVRKDTTYHTSGKQTESTSCSSGEDLPEDVPCRVLNGWLTVHYWKGVRSIDQYDFCSFTCLQRWVEARAPKIPSTFLKVFPED